jgi:hypothetical protein
MPIGKNGFEKKNEFLMLIDSFDLHTLHRKCRVAREEEEE